MKVRQSRSRGASAVEFALVLPLFMLLVLGSVDWGYYFFVTQIVTNAAREGARAGSLESDDATAITSATNATNTYLGNAGLSSANATLTVTAPSASSIRVNLQYPAGSLSGYAAIVMPSAAKAVAEMRRL